MQYAGCVITSTKQEQLEQYGHRVYQDVVDPVNDTYFSVIPPGVNQQVFSLKQTEADVIVSDRIKAAGKRDISKGRRQLPMVLISSRLDPKKNLIGVVRAFAYSLELREKANLGIAVRALENPLHDYGSLTAEEIAVMDEIVALINEADLWDVVMAFPLNGQAELAAAYRVLAKRQSVFALTALYEPFGLVPLEAMSCGLPTVVTKNGGPAESMMQDGKEFGVLVDPSDPADISDGILRVMESAHGWQKFSKAGIKRVTDKYTWDRTAEGYLTVFSDLIRENQPQDQIEIPFWFNNPSAENEIPLELLSKLYFG